MRLERTTIDLEGRCSIQLSYSPISAYSTRWWGVLQLLDNEVYDTLEAAAVPGEDDLVGAAR